MHSDWAIVECVQRERDIGQWGGLLCQVYNRKGERLAVVTEISDSVSQPWARGKNELMFHFQSETVLGFAFQFLIPMYFTVLLWFGQNIQFDKI